MRISQRLILGFLAIAMWVAVVGHISLYQLNQISDPLNSKIPESVESIGKTAYLDGLAQVMRYYNEVLTQSARNYAFTQDKKWEQRYKDFRSKLSQVIKNAIDNGEEKDREFFLNIGQINLAHVEMESKSIELVNNGQPKEAINILESSIYWDQKRSVEQDLENYVSRRGIQYDEALSNSTRAVTLATERAQYLIKTSTRLILIFGVVALSISIGAGLLISRSIYVPLLKLKAAAVEIGKGKLNTQIEVKSNDEVGQLATSFKIMLNDLRKTTTSIDNLNREITERRKAEENVRHAYEDLEKANQELKEMQSQLVQSEKLSSIGQLAAGVAHEMNTPVGFVASNFETLEIYMGKFQELLQMYDELFEKIETSDKAVLLDRVDAISKSRNEMKIDFIMEDLSVLFNDSREGIDRVTRIVQNLRDFSRIDQPENFDIYNINDGIKTTLVVAQNEIKNDADVEMELSEVPDIICNTGQINQVLLNIIMNATQAIKSQERNDKGTITIRTYTMDGDVVCEISDDGPGIEPDWLDKIFDPFFTTKPIGQGTGLGLSISYDIIVNKHKGILLVDNSVGNGTKFTIKLSINKKSGKKELEKENSRKEDSIIC
ncbi:MAG: HAMP domain-containing protein [Planctomycetes bacterium]|nr:HAMP domain-containing protein [Planctomycetota bacterium]MBL7142844.1 HAMP domain-containing protein [Phycisphaerae bacterium]